MTPEIINIRQNLIGHLKGMLRWSRQMTPEQFDFTYHVAAPTARTLVTHAWQWLTCDRQHIEEPDASKHPLVMEAPQDMNALCDELEAETNRWDAMLQTLTAEQLDEVRHQFNNTDFDWSVRGCLYHMLQNTIYKHGQLSYLAFSFGLDGTEPYEAPFPNVFYKETSFASLSWAV
jgi:hypothetical protein